MQIRLLGTVEIATQEGVRRVGGAKERRLLALLALRAGEVVSEDRIVDALWGDEPPRTATKTVQGHVSRLRRALADGGFSIEAHGPGYVLRTPPMGTDVEHVDALLTEGRGLAATDPMGAVAVFVQALATWRGPALSEFADDPLFVGDAARLAELRLSLVEERLAAELACGRHGALAGELEALCRAHPTRERLWAYRMRALYGSGRQVDALAVYQEVRRYLAEELGLEPSSELRALEQAILAHDQSLDWYPPPATDAEPILVSQAKTLPTGVVTFLLTDIEGSTGLWDVHPHEMADALARHDHLIADAVAAHGGSLLKSRGEGDSTFSAFPRATGAAAAALAIRRAFADTVWPEGAPLRVRVAIHTGEAHERDGDYYGPTVNRAARLRSIAKGGQILLSQSVADLVADHIDDHGAALVELGSYQFADLSRPERIYEMQPEGDTSVLDPTTSEAPCPPFPAPLASVIRAPFVGRVRELAVLGRLRDEASNALRAVLVAGEPGIGKTRVAAAVAADAHAHGACVLYGRCDEDASAPYQPMVEALSTYAAAIPRPVLRAQVGHSGAELARLVPDIADVVLTKPSQPGADPESDRYRLFEAVSRFVATLASTRPVVVVLDDLHWADKPTLLLVRHLLRATAELPILLLGTYRDTELNLSQPLADVLADLRREQLIERIGLAGLRQDDISELTVATVGRDLPDKVVAEIYHQTQGNPFFAGEVLHHLADSDAFDEKAIAQLGIPEGIREVVGRRVRRLEGSTVALLTTAAVMGREFDLDVVQTAGGVAPGEALDSVEEALRARLVEEIPGSTSRYAFTHALVRDTLYRELVTSRRVRLHGAIAEAIENTHGDRADWIGELAFHYTESAHSGGIDKAVQYSRRAGDRALTLFAYEDAVGHYEGALHALDLDPSGADDARRVEVLLALADAVWRVGGGVPARARFHEAGALARRLARYDLLADAALGMARHIVVSPVGAEGAPAVDDAHVDLVHAALETTPTADSELRARLLAAMAVATFYGTDQHQPRELADNACAMAERIGDTGALVETLSVRRAVLEAFDPEVDERLELDTRIEHLARQRGDLTTVADALLWQSADLLQLGRIDDADAALDRYAALAANLSDPRIPYWCLVYQATRARIEGRFTDAEQLATDALTLSGVQPAVALTIFGGQMLWMWVDQGRVGELRAAMDAILGFAAAMPAAKAGLAVMATELGELDTAQSVWDELAWADFDDFPHDAGRVAGLVCLTVACRALDDQPRASILYRLFLPYQSQHAIAAAVLHLGPVDHYLGLLAATTGDLDTAAAHFETALAMSLHIGARPFAAHTQAELADVLARRARPGDEVRTSELLRAALATAEELGMPPLADQARSQLGALPPFEETSTTGEG